MTIKDYKNKAKLSRYGARTTSKTRKDDRTCKDKYCKICKKKIGFWNSNFFEGLCLDCSDMKVTIEDELYMMESLKKEEKRRKLVLSFVLREKKRKNDKEEDRLCGEVIENTRKELQRHLKEKYRG